MAEVSDLDKRESNGVNKEWNKSEERGFSIFEGF